MSYSLSQYAEMLYFYGVAQGNGSEAARLYREALVRRGDVMEHYPDHRVFINTYNTMLAGRIPGRNQPRGAVPLDPDQVEEVLEEIQRDPSTSSRKITRQTGIPRTTVLKILNQARLARAASETKTTTPKVIKSMRRVSVDVVSGSEAGSPTGSPARRSSRRASFNKACEALHTPKGRRTSTDARKEADSPSESPTTSEAGSGTPARRARRASTHSNTSQAKADTSKRSKKTSAADESKDKKK